VIIVEYEAKGLLKARGLPVPPGLTADTPEDARRAADQLGGAAVVKAQVPTGGRMKAGVIRFANTPVGAERAARELLGMTRRGFRVERLLIEQKLTITREFFVAATYDAAARTALLLTSAEGGIEIESVGAVGRFPFSSAEVLSDYVGREAAASLGLQGKPFLQLSRLAKQVAEAFSDFDALLLECNPVVLDDKERLWLADVHFELDDDALYRQKSLIEAAPFSAELANRRTAFENHALEIDQADHRGIAGRLIPFDGNIGLLIGGGGASLTTMDALLDAGLKPANYCEIGGNPSVWKTKELTKLILSQPQVDRLVVIMNVVSNTRVDLVARGVIKGILEMGRDPKDVIAAFRIPGSWEDEGYKLLDHYGVRYFGRETTIEQVIESML
jgi:succinyl-CoA synthetase beta subunit/citryl-CoA synthetase large subunit